MTEDYEKRIRELERGTRFLVKFTTAWTAALAALLIAWSLVCGNG